VEGSKGARSKLRRTKPVFGDAQNTLSRFGRRENVGPFGEVEQRVTRISGRLVLSYEHEVHSKLSHCFNPVHSLLQGTKGDAIRIQAHIFLPSQS
jgi:hypothetical protein